MPGTAACDGTPRSPRTTPPCCSTGSPSRPPPRVLHLSTTDQREWDDFESTWLAGREEGLAAHPDHPDAVQLRADLDARLRRYVGGYRGVLGLASPVLAR
ncbi:hypothetical protein [Plantactinospora sp. GCM10030261]|uniref:hypothetical protein n=1 Tax=Plantactinospora sp. GCM10030261 TaxID=3273420 RepID=UPI00360A706D